MSTWFMIALGVLQALGAAAFLYEGKPTLAGVWFSYAAAQIFWAMEAAK